MNRHESDEMAYCFKKNWQVKDNIIIALNTFNRYQIINKDAKSSALFAVDNLYKLCKAYSIKHNVSMLEASKVLKEFVKKNKEMHKNSLQNGIKEL